MYVLVGPALNVNLQYEHLLLHSSILNRVFCRHYYKKRPRMSRYM